MKVFLDFEASSLSDRSHPIEVAWVSQDGRSETHLIAPAPTWNDWDAALAVSLPPAVVDHRYPLRQWEALDLDAALAEALRGVGVARRSR